MRNILILADLTSPLMKPRILMLKDLPYRKYILHNANNVALSEEILSSYEGFIVLEHPEIESLKLRYLYSFFYTLYLLVKLNPKLIVVHWASRLYQNLLLALFGKRVIVHTMGGDIDSAQDYRDKKRKYVDILLKSCRIISVKSDYMAQMIKYNVELNEIKIVKISFGVDRRFLQKISQEEKMQLQYKNFGREFDFLFFSIRAFDPFYRQKEIIEAFLQNFRDNLNVGLVISSFRMNNAYYNEVSKCFTDNIFICEIAHEKIHEFIASCDCVVSFSKSDGLSQSIMESLAMRKLVLCNELPHYKELLNQGNSIIYKDVNDLKEGFLKALINREFKESNMDTLDAEIQKKHYLRILKEEFNV